MNEQTKTPEQSGTLKATAEAGGVSLSTVKRMAKDGAPKGEIAEICRERHAIKNEIAKANLRKLQIQNEMAEIALERKKAEKAELFALAAMEFNANLILGKLLIKLADQNPEIDAEVVEELTGDLAERFKQELNMWHANYEP